MQHSSWSYSKSKFVITSPDPEDLFSRGLNLFYATVLAREEFMAVSRQSTFLVVPAGFHSIFVLDFLDDVVPLLGTSSR